MPFVTIVTLVALAALVALATLVALAALCRTCHSSFQVPLAHIFERSVLLLCLISGAAIGFYHGVQTALLEDVRVLRHVSRQISRQISRHIFPAT